MSNRNSLNLTLKILATLSHKVRNPLNVISNDINYLKAIYPEEDCDRALTRCRQIVDFFKPLDLLESTIPENLDLTALINEIFEGKSDCTAAFMLMGNYKNMRQAVIWLYQFFEITSVIQSKQELFRFTLKDPVESDYNSIAELYSLRFRDESILPLLTEAVFESANIKFIANKNHFDLSRL